MIATLLAGLVLVGIATALGVRALAFGRIQAAERLRNITLYGFRAGQQPETAPAANLGLQRIAERIGQSMSGQLTRIDMAQMRRDLLGAGFYTVTPEAYLGYRIIATSVLTAFLVLFAATAPSMLMIMGVLIGAVLGWRVPSIVIQRRAAQRYAEVDRELPELIDLLVVSVEAGLGLGGALQLITNRLTGPLGDELRLTLREQSMGLDANQALSNLLDRCDTPSVRSFVRSLQQGERLGVSIGSILRNLAVEMRTRRRQAAEERAQKAPIKMLFPLIFLIFPAMFVVLLGPAFFSLKNVFGGG